MKEFNEERIKALKEKYQKSVYVKRDWTTDPEDDLTLEQYCMYVDPTLLNIDKKRYPSIISKVRDNGGTFLKMSIPLIDGSTAECDLSYKHTFKLGDQLDVDTLMFRTEKSLGKEHSYATGDIV